MALPHFVEARQDRLYQHFCRKLADYPEMKVAFDEGMRMLNREFHHVLKPFLSRYPAIEMLMGARENDQDISQAAGILGAYRFEQLHGRVFEIDPALNELLENTDIGRSAPCSSFQSPYPVIYFHFPGGADIAVGYDRDRQYIKRSLSGCYLFELEPDNRPESAMFKLHGQHRLFELVFTSELIDGDFGDTLTLNTQLTLPDTGQDLPLTEVIEAELKRYIHAGGEFHGFSNGQSVPFEVLNMNLIAHITKCLLFINTGEALMETDNSLDELKDRLSRVRPGKRKKLERRLERSYNKIIIRHRPDEVSPSAAQTQANANRKRHWRRGHFRNQAYGKGFQERKTIWIRPMLIGYGEAGMEKIYRVKN